MSFPRHALKQTAHVARLSYVVGRVRPPCSPISASSPQANVATIPGFLLPSFHTSRQYQTLPLTRAPLRPLRRHFSISSSCRQVKTTANPRKDEDGNEMVVDITPRAANRLSEIMTEDSNPSLALRVEVQSGGCHGFQYLMSLASAKDASPEDDTIFEAGDGSGAKVIMDEPSLELLKGSKVDFTMELIGSQFKIVGNPAASSSCGCGTSFDIKM